MNHSELEKSFMLTYKTLNYSPMHLRKNNRRNGTRSSSYVNVLNSKYFAMSGLKTFTADADFSIGFENFLKLFVSKYNSGSYLFNGQNKNLMNYSVLRCQNSSKRIVENLKRGSLTCYTPTSFDNREYVLFSDTILECPVLGEGEILNTNLRYFNFCKPVMVLVVEFEEFINKVKKITDKYEQSSIGYNIPFSEFHNSLQYKLLVDKDFSTRKDSKSLLSRVLKHYYHQTEETKKSVDVVYTTSEEIVKNTFSEMYFQFLDPPKRLEIIEELVSKC